MKKIIFPFVACTILMMSCKKYLDIIPDDVATLSFAFSNRTTTETYLSTCYSYLPPFGTRFEPGVAAGDDLLFHLDLNQFPNPGYYLLNFGNNVTNPYLNFWNGLQSGSWVSHWWSTEGVNLWKGIRDCNIFLENIHGVRDMPQFEKERWAAEVKFLKAYYHFYLFKLYGPIPIVRKNIPISASPEEVAVYRLPVDSVVNYIVELIDEATPDLPMTIVNAASEMGRVTKPVALAMKAKVLVTAASPLYNGNTDYAKMRDNRGVQLFNQTNDPTKWTRALNACKNAIDTCTLAGIELYRFRANPSVANSLVVSDTTKLVLQVSTIITDKWNPEKIWGISRFSSAKVQTQTTADLSPNMRDQMMIFRVPQLKMMEMFYSDKGVPIEEDKTYDYTNRFELTTTTNATRYYMQPNYQTVKLSLNREPRLYGSMGIDGGLWFGLGRLNDTNQWPIDCKLGSGKGGRIGSETYSISGLWIKKYSNYLSTYSGVNFKDSKYDWPLLRLADLYLLYAEALNETLTAPNQDVYKYVDMIRKRTGLEGVVEAWNKYSTFPQKPLSKNGMREIIHRERNIELVFEGHRFWDTRRWKEAINYYNEPVRGWNIDGATPADFYQPITYPHHQYILRDVLWPIRELDISTNKNLLQNPGW